MIYFFLLSVLEYNVCITPRGDKRERILTGTMKRRPKTIITVLLVAGIAACGSLPGIAQSPNSLDEFFTSVFPDTGDLRAKLFSTIIGAPRDLALAYGTKTHQTKFGTVTVRAVKRDTDFIIEFVNGTGESPTMGSCYIQRSNAKGYMVQAKILLQDDPSCYLRLYPETSGSGTRGDVVMYGAVIKKGLRFDGMLYRIIILPFSDIVDLTKRSFDWSIVFRTEETNASAALLAELRQPLPAPVPQPSQSTPPRTALASIPSPTTQPAVSKAATRAARLYEIIDRSQTIEALTLELAQSGETGAREISLAADAAAGFGNDQGDPGFSAFGAFPRYEAGRGIVLPALRAALFLDLQANPDSAYILVADAFRAVAAPSVDESGSLSFSFFCNGKELSWKDLVATGKDQKVRVVRIPASRS